MVIIRFEINAVILIFLISIVLIVLISIYPLFPKPETDMSVFQETHKPVLEIVIERLFHHDDVGPSFYHLQHRTFRKVL